VDYHLIPVAFRRSLLAKTKSLLSGMNIFCLYNTLWGLARCRMDVAEMDALAPGLSSPLLLKTVAVLHTFIAAAQYSDVVWSLGSLKYRRDMLQAPDQDRLIAVRPTLYFYRGQSMMIIRNNTGDESRVSEAESAVGLFHVVGPG
jgi:hypothetical protein